MLAGKSRSFPISAFMATPAGFQYELFRGRLPPNVDCFQLHVNCVTSTAYSPLSAHSTMLICDYDVSGEECVRWYVGIVSMN